MLNREGLDAAHYRNIGHATEDCPDLLAKWEAKTWQHNVNLVNFEPRTISESEDPRINVITRGGAKTDGDDVTRGPT